MKAIITFALITIFMFQGAAQSFEKQIDIDHSFGNTDSPVMIIMNISGDITIREHQNDNLTGIVHKTISAETKALLESTKKDVKLQKTVRNDTVIFYIATPCNQSTNDHHGKRWGYQWSEDCKWESSADYRFDFNVAVPAGVEILASTINNGDITIEKSSGKVNAKNINGEIILSHLSGKSVKASTINGDIEIRFDQNPTDSCRFYTLNGDINAYFPSNLSAQIKFKSFQGDFFTDIEEVKTLPQTRLVQTKKEKGVKYRINDATVMEIRSASTLFIEFETFNGDVFLRTNK